MRTTFDQTIIQAIEMAIRNARLAPLFLGGTTASGGGAGSPPGGYIGTLPQTRVSYDLSEAATLATAISGSLLDNLNHIRYRIQVLESGGGPSSLAVYENDILVASGITILNFEGGVNVTNNGGGKVTVLVSGVAGSGVGATTFLELTDTPASYVGHSGKYVVVNALENSLEFVSWSGQENTDEKVKVSLNDTTTNYLENKLVAGANVSITVLNEGGNEQLQISASGITGSGATTFLELTDTPATYVTHSGEFVKVNDAETGVEFEAGVDISSNDANITAINFLNQSSEPASPAVNHTILYATISGLFEKDSFGNVVGPLGTGGSGTLDTKTVKVSSNDLLDNYLENKIIAGTNINISVLNEGGNEQLEINVSGVVTSGIDDKRVKVSTNDTTDDFLENKVVAGSNVSITVLNEGGNEQLQISSSGVVGSGLRYRQFTWVSTSGTWEFVSYSGEPVLNLENLE